VTEIWFELVVGFLVGLLLGSFLNVCIARLPEHESVVRPRSRCMSCGHPVRWYDNVPIVSWVVLRGRCRDCGAGISCRYPAVELAVGLWFAAVIANTWVSIGNDHNGQVGQWMFERIHLDVLSGVSAGILGFLLIGLLVMDWETMRLPDAFTLPGIGIGFVLVCVRAAFLSPGEGDIVLNTTHQLRMSSPGSFQSRGNVFMTGSEAMVLGRVAAICGAALILLLVRWTYKGLRGRDGMGLGDVKLLAMLAAFLGLGQSVLALLAGVLAASAYGLGLMAMRKAGPESKLPFGSFLAAGGLAVALWGQRVVDWYIGLLR
jgi:leader peptidase (prepilin peptidase) / N-methyltransferase